MKTAIIRIICLIAPLIAASHAHAQSVTTYTSRTAFNAALPGDAVITLEDFSSISTNYVMSTSGDQFEGFTVSRTGTGYWGDSGYCPLLNSGPITPIYCIDYNGSSPALPGLVGSYDTNIGITFTPDNEIYAFGFDSVDWNDGSERSRLTIHFSNGSNVEIAGPLNQAAGFFGYVLDSSSISSGIYITSIQSLGYNGAAELVGYWDITTGASPGIAQLQVAGNAISITFGQSAEIMDTGDTATFDVTFTNSTLVAIASVTLTSSLSGALVVCPSTGSNTISNISAGDVEVCSVTYSLVQSDFDTDGGGDGDLDGAVTAIYDVGAGNVALIDDDALSITQIPDITVTKNASPKVNVAAGQTITYTYSITNTGNVTISDVSLSDSHNASGPDVIPHDETLATPGGVPVSTTTSDAIADSKIWDSLGPGDIVEFTGQYTVTQNDVDTLQ